jgi:hypothetical protein
MDEYRFGPEDQYRMLVACDAVSRERALSLVYGVYLASGLTEPRKSQMLVSVHDMMPETTSLLVERRTGGSDAGDAVASLTMIPDGPMDLPLDRLARTSLNSLRVAGRRPVELAKLATVASTELHAGGGRTPREEILLHLFRLAYLAALRLDGATDLVVAVAPYQERYFRRVLLFDRMPEDQGTGQALSIALRLPLEVAEQRYRKRYGHRRTERNLYAFFREGNEVELLDWLSRFRRPLSAADAYQLFARRCRLLLKVDEATRRAAAMLYPGLDTFLAASDTPGT